MTFKKNWFSVSVWILFTLFSAMVLSGVLYRMLTNYWIITEIYVNIGIAVGALAFLGLLYFLVLKWNFTIPLTNPKLLEAFAFTCVCGLGIGLRCFFMLETDTLNFGIEDNFYFNTAQINGADISAFPSGMTYLYLIILRGLYFVFGNQYVVGIVFQIAIQFLASFIWYAAIRKMAGILTASVYLTGIMLMPQSIIMSLSYSPNMLYLLFAGIVLLMIAGLLKKEHLAVGFKWYTYVYAVFIGAGIGFLAFADVSGLIFLIPVLALCFVNIRENTDYEFETNKIKRRFFTLLSILVSGVAVFLVLSGFFCNTAGFDLLKGLRTWYSMYTFKGLKDISVIFFNKESDVGCIIVLVLLILGVFAFFKNKKNENQLIWLFLLAGASVIYIGNFHSEYLKPDALLLCFKLALTGAGMRALFRFKNVSLSAVEISSEKVVDEKEEVKKKETKKKKTKKEVAKEVEVEKKPLITELPEQPTVHEPVLNTEPQVEKKPVLIENPLPLPKKHVKKIMSYGMTVPRYKMKYDVQVSDDDDFDIQ